jgi:hypothetical protein
MTIVFLAPLSRRRRAAAVETRWALDAGHRVVLIAEGTPEWDAERLDDRVETVWLAANDLRAAKSAPVWFLVKRLPLGILRRLGRGPLRPLAEKVAYRWRRHAVRPLERRFKDRTAVLRHAHRMERIPAVLAATAPDRLVLHEPHALELAAEFLPGLLRDRPGLVVGYDFTPDQEAAGAR